MDHTNRSATRNALLDGKASSSNAPHTDSFGGGSKLAEVQAQVDGVRAVMQDNVSQMLANMDQAAALETSSAELATQARSFATTARKTKHSMWWQNARIKLAVAAGCLVVLLLILAWCGVFNGSDKRRRLLMGF
mmetsp:Transcript_48610/g.105389  ORF Transcript_48610/g.105389 Transcript_48610/m.105389 type:complete len:134 (+) Transcript_48610:233-634(+)